MARSKNNTWLYILLILLLLLVVGLFLYWRWKEGQKGAEATTSEPDAGPPAVVAPVNPSVLGPPSWFTDTGNNKQIEEPAPDISPGVGTATGGSNVNKNAPSWLFP